MGREISYGLSLEDKGTAAFQQFVSNVEAGSKEVESAVKSTNLAIDSQGKLTRTLTGYVKEQRAEQRLQNFLFREARDVVSTAGLAMTLFAQSTDNVNSTFRAVSTAVNTGIVAFQGFNAALGALGVSSGVGLAIAALGSLALAIKQFADQNEDANIQLGRTLGTLNSQIAEMEFKLGKISKAEALHGLIEQVRDAGREWRELDRNMEKTPENLVKIAEAEKKYREAQLAQLHFEKSLADQKEKAHQDEVKRAQERMNLAQANLKNIQDVAIKEGEFLFQVFDEEFKVIDAFMKAMKASQDGTLTYIKTKFQLTAIETGKEVIRLNEETLADFTANMEVASNLLGGFQTATNQAFTSMFSGTAGSAKAFLKSILLTIIDMVQGMLLAAAAAVPLKGIFTFLTSLAADIPALIAATVALQAARAFVSTKFHQGGTAFINASPSTEIPIIVRGQETVRVTTPEQERAGAGGGNTIVIQQMNFYGSSPSFSRLVVDAIKDAVRDTGLPIDQLTVNKRSNVVLAS